MAIESRLMSQQLMTRFIEEYKANSVLWDSNSKNYYNKTYRWEGYRKLVDIVKPYYANADIYFVRKKINTLNGIIRKEHNKYVQSLKNGNNIYKPKLWYYHLMDFIINNENKQHRAFLKNDVQIKPGNCKTLKIENSEEMSQEIVGRSNRQLSKKLLTAFIKLYEKNPCLWKVGEASYTNKKMRDSALDELVKLIKTECPEANRNFVKKKLNTLRGSARMEHKKYLIYNKSKKYYQYKPSLWYYNLIKFVFDSPHTKTVDIFDTPKILPNLQDDPNQCIENEELPQLTVSEEYLNSTDDHIDKDDNINNMFYDDNRKHYEFHCFAKAVAAKLRKIHSKDENQRYICEKLINDILLKAFQNKLTDKTTLTETRQIQFFYSNISQETIEIPGSSKTMTLNTCGQPFVNI